MSEAEAFVEYLDKNDYYSIDEFRRYKSEFFGQGSSSLAVQAQFMSKGGANAWIKDVLEKKYARRVLYSFIIYSAVLGNDQLGMPGVVNPDTIKTIIDEFVQGWVSGGGEFAKSNMQLSMPDYQNSFLNPSDNDEI